MARGTYRCIYCKEALPDGVRRLSDTKNHGPGKCCDACRLCRENVPHQPRHCANGKGIYGDAIAWAFD